MRNVLIVVGVAVLAWFGLIFVAAQRDSRTATPTSNPVVDRAQRFTATYTVEQVKACRNMVDLLVRTHAVHAWEGDYVVTVGHSFHSLDWQQKHEACGALDVVRQSKGLDPDFRIYDAYTNRLLGKYLDGKLTWEP